MTKSPSSKSTSKKNKKIELNTLDFGSMRIEETDPRYNLMNLDTLVNFLPSKNIFFLQVGAMDGVRYDPIYKYVNEKSWKGILVEPIKDVFELLKKNYSGHEGLIFENIAIDDVATEIVLNRITEQVVIDNNLPEWLIGCTSMYDDRNYIGAPEYRNYSIKETVKATSLESLLEKHKVKKIDVLVVDTEGHDYHIIKQLDFDKYQPAIIFAEYGNLPEQEKELLVKLLAQNGYLYVPGFDIIAVKQEILNKNSEKKAKALTHKNINETSVSKTMKKLPKIFVQIASYRDPECQWTVKDLFEKAAHPERIFVGICWQTTMPEDAHCFKVPYPFPSQVRVSLFEAKDSKGCCWARTVAQELCEDEEYTLQIDSHMRFEKNWDEILINMLDECDSNKPVLTTYPAHYVAPNELYYSLNILAADKFYEGFLLKIPYQINRVREKPIKAAFMAGGFSFGASQRFKEVPIDPKIYFFGEECALTIRLWTNGWDFFHPNKVMIYHLYDRAGRRMHYQDHANSTEIDRKSYARVRHLLGLQISNDPEVTEDLDKYPLGTARSFEDYQNFCGVNYKTQTITDKAKNAIFDDSENNNLQITEFAKIEQNTIGAIPDDWKKWIFENLLDGYQPDGLTSIMIEKGFNSDVSKAAVNEVITSPFMPVTTKYKEKLHKREWLLKTLDWHRRHNDYYTQPKKVPLPSFKDFLRDYYYENRIGIFSGAIDHWGAAKWTFPDLVKKVGYDSMVEVQSGRDKEADYEVKGASLKTQIKFGEFIDKITSVDSSNDMYMTANNHPFGNPAMRKLLTDFDNIGDGYFDMDKFADRCFLWLGPKGVITPLHQDLTNNFFIQVHGRKTYHLIPSMQVPYMYDNLFVYSDVDLIKSDLSKFPEFNKATPIRVDLEPGDSLFIPIGYWHHVVGLTPNMSLTVTNMNVENTFPNFMPEKFY